MLERKKILIIDDEQDLCFFLANNLKESGNFNVTYAHSGKDGLELVKSFAPDIVILDIDLGDVNGITLIKDILKVNRKIRVIMLSGKGTHEDVQMALEAGAVDFATKPCSVDRMIKIIDEHLGIKSKPKQTVKVAHKAAKITKSLLLDTLAGFVSVSEAKSNYLKGHSERVAEISMKIGQKLGLSKEQLEILEYSSILHDLGKVGTKDATLEKEGKFDEEDWVEIKKHPSIGADIINKVRLFRLEESNIRHHHERFDGKGYPDGLKGKNIPLGARIIALADAFDAMTSERPYKPRLSDEEAINEIKRCSGTQFEPEVVEAFLALIEKEKKK